MPHEHAAAIAILENAVECLRQSIASASAGKAERTERKRQIEASIQTLKKRQNEWTPPSTNMTPSSPA
jgi:prefoldin subunit 5